MIVTKEVEVKWTNRNKEWYQSKGYQFTKLRDKFMVKTSDLTVGASNKVEVKCDYCGITKVKPYFKYVSSHENADTKDACSKCRGVKAKETMIDKYGENYKSKFVSESTTKHSLDFIRNEFKQRGYLLISTKYKGNKSKLAYRCERHPEVVQYIRYNDLQQGHGCAECAKEIKPVNALTYDFVKSEFEKRGYELISTKYKDNKTKMSYRCKKHPEIIQKIKYNVLQQGCGCRFCSSSRGEKAIEEFLVKHHITYATQYTFSDLVYKKKLRFDFCILNDDGVTIDTLCEFNGIQHYEKTDFAGRGQEWAEAELKETRKRDKLKADYCKSHNIPLLVIRYDEFSFLEEILARELL